MAQKSYCLTGPVRRRTRGGVRHPWARTTHRARIGNPRYRTCVVSYSRELAITSTMSPERSGNSACSVAWTARCGTPASSVLACCSSSFRNRMVPVELSLLGFTLQLHFQDNPNRIWSDAFATSRGRTTPAPPRCHEIATGRVRLLTAQVESWEADAVMRNLIS